MISINNLVKYYKNHKVLNGIKLEVKKGEVYGFIGHNGAGKSTTMNILAGLIEFQHGECFVNGKAVKGVKNRSVKDIGYLPEDPRFYPYMNAYEYLNYIGSIGGEDRQTILKKSDQLLQLVKLDKAAKRPVGGYSRGMKQRLGIAVAMYHDPEVLLFDEPSSALDPEGRMDVISIIEELKSRGKTIFLSTHILNDIERVCDRIGILHGGKIVLEDNLVSLMKHYIQPVYDVEFGELPAKEKIDMLKSQAYMEKVTSEDKTFSFWLKNVEKDSNTLISDIAALGAQVVSINLRKSSLEEIFLKVVQ
jgi:ABC-2 type transport system ATP-binding protein